MAWGDGSEEGPSQRVWLSIRELHPCSEGGKNAKRRVCSVDPFKFHSLSERAEGKKSEDIWVGGEGGATALTSFEGGGGIGRIRNRRKKLVIYSRKLGFDEFVLDRVLGSGGRKLGKQRCRSGRVVENKKMRFQGIR